MKNFEYYIERVNARNFKKIKRSDVQGANSRTQVYSGKKNNIFIKTEPGKADTFIRNNFLIVVEYAAYKVLHEMRKVMSGIKIPKASLSYDIIDRKDFWEGGIKLQLLTTAKKGRFVMDVVDKSMEKNDRLFLAKISVFANFLIPMMIIGSDDLHSENVIMNPKTKSYYAIDFGMAFERSIGEDIIRDILRDLLNSKELGELNPEPMEYFKRYRPTLYKAVIERIKKSKKLLAINYSQVLNDVYDDFVKLFDKIEKENYLDEDRIEIEKEKRKKVEEKIKSKIEGFKKIIETNKEDAAELLQDYFNI